MRLNLATTDITNPEALESYAKVILATAFGSLQARVQEVQLKLIDTNGPSKGGLDKRCWMTLRLSEGPDIVAESIHEHAQDAISLSAAEAASMLARRVRALRNETTQTRRKPHESNH